MVCTVKRGLLKVVVIAVKGIERTFQSALIMYYTLYSTKPYVSDSVNRGISTAKRAPASLYDWIVYKRGSKAKERKRRKKDK